MDEAASVPVSLLFLHMLTPPNQASYSVFQTEGPNQGGPETRNLELWIPCVSFERISGIRGFSVYLSHVSYNLKTKALNE